MIVNKLIYVQSECRPTFHDLTEEVTAIVKKTGVQQGSVLVFSQHTTCSVFIQEQSDDVNYYGTQLVLQDMLNIFEKIIPTCHTEGQYLHPGPKHVDIASQERQEEAWWSLNTDAHLRSVLLGRSETIPIEDENLQLGEFGRIYFADFDQVRARKRTIRIQIQGE